MNPRFIYRKLRRTPTVTRILTNLLSDLENSSTSNVMGVETKAIDNIGRSDHKEGEKAIGKDLQGPALVPFPSQ